MFDAFIDEIKKLKNVHIAIVTSNSIDIVNHKRDALVFTPTHILGIEDHHSKEEKIEQICRDR
ncbi:hypothetical protein KAZ93_04985 [Patescibacteria group bacterium]|nr:hypothetical protein [Patescibacteria group bacterium]